jgi:large conductance mechanosensitive channel
MQHKNLPEKFVVLRRGPHGDKGYNTLLQAREDGASTMAYGYIMSSVSCATLILTS